MGLMYPRKTHSVHQYMGKVTGRHSHSTGKWEAHCACIHDRPPPVPTVPTRVLSCPAVPTRVLVPHTDLTHQECQQAALTDGKCGSRVSGGVNVPRGYGSETLDVLYFALQTCPVQAAFTRFTSSWYLCGLAHRGVRSLQRRSMMVCAGPRLQEVLCRLLRQAARRGQHHLQ